MVQMTYQDVAKQDYLFWLIKIKNQLWVEHNVNLYNYHINTDNKTVWKVIEDLWPINSRWQIVDFEDWAKWRDQYNALVAKWNKKGASRLAQPKPKKTIEFTKAMKARAEAIEKEEDKKAKKAIEEKTKLENKAKLEKEKATKAKEQAEKDEQEVINNAWK